MLMIKFGYQKGLWLTLSIAIILFYPIPSLWFYERLPIEDTTLPSPHKCWAVVVTYQSASSCVVLTYFSFCVFVVLQFSGLHFLFFHFQICKRFLPFREYINVFARPLVPFCHCLFHISLTATCTHTHIHPFIHGLTFPCHFISHPCTLSLILP